MRLATSLDALAALAAALRVESEGLDADPEARALLDAIATELLGEPIGELGTAGGAVVGMARAFLRQASDVIEHPGRDGSWETFDEPLLQGIGRLSMAITQAFRVAGTALDGLGDRWSAPGSRFLDVGTGTGWLSIATARMFPNLDVVGLDVFDAALALARANVASEGLEGRIDLRLQDVAELDEVDAYDIVWLPLPFLPAAVVPQAVAAASRALRPGGWILPGTFAGPDDRLSLLLTDLRIVRSGGHPWQTDEMLTMLADHGFSESCEVPRTWAAPVRLFAARLLP